MYQEATDIRSVYLYKKFAVQVGSWYTGERCSIDKNQRGVGLQHTKYIIANGKLRQYCQLSDKSMKFCIVVHHDLTNDFSHNSKQSRSQNRYFWVK